MVEDAGSVLRAGIHALPVLGRRIMHPVEKLDQRAVGQSIWVEGDLHGLGVCRVRHQPCVKHRTGRNEDVRPVRPEHTAL